KSENMQFAIGTRIAVEHVNNGEPGPPMLALISYIMVALHLRRGITMWTRNALQDLIQSKLGDRRLIMVANREPYLHRFSGGKVECVPPASGMVSALEPIMRACGGVWIAHGSGNADRRTTDANDHIQVPPGDPKYTLRRVWLTKAQQESYYNGAA